MNETTKAGLTGFGIGCFVTMLLLRLATGGPPVYSDDKGAMRWYGKTFIVAPGHEIVDGKLVQIPSTDADQQPQEREAP